MILNIFQQDTYANRNLMSISIHVLSATNSQINVLLL